MSAARSGPAARARHVVLATRNQGKAKEFGRLLGPAFTIEPLPEAFSLPEETGATFHENARLKALHAFEALGGGTAVLADDSGIEVRALGGEPGVWSARYAGEGAADAANVDLLLRRLGDTPDRAARFVCVLVLILPATPSSSVLLEAEGLVEGAVTTAPRGDAGFGYDPVFQPAGWEHTLGEASPEAKDAVSHRGRAVQALLAMLAEEEDGEAGGGVRPPVEVDGT